ncbi:MAG: NAD(P)-dependent oxidoreductase [Gemmatimonadetes bacterium]|nr:NAD(P)-dependent oxidoreductase [Gemmatimonadota bacterium]
MTTAAATPTIGFIGLGRMGMPMCRNLLAKGNSLLVFNRTASKAAPLAEAGATVAPTIQELARRSDVVITCLDTTLASEVSWLYAEGIVACARPGTLLIDHGTIPPALARRVDAAARERGQCFIDAPVSGGPEGAERGTLAIMMGGTVDAVARARPILESYGSTLVHLGAVGAGTHAKLVNQLLTFVHGMAAAEALALADRAGLELDALGKLLQASFGHSRMFDRTLARVHARDYEAGAALRLFEKDLAIIAEAGKELGIDLPLVAVARSWVQLAQEQGLGDRDIAALRLLYPGLHREEAPS